MHETLRLRDIRFTAGTSAESAAGLLGWVTLRYGDLLVDGITLRRTLDGRHVLAFPRPPRRGAAARQLVRPAGAHERRRLEDAVIAELRRQGAVP